MDTHAAQLRHQIDETRAAMDAQVTQLEQRVSQMPAVRLSRTCWDLCAACRRR